MKTLSFLAILTCLIFPCASKVIAAQTATAQISGGFVIGYTITDGGSGYTNNPTVQIVGGGGSGATATAMISDSGVVTNLAIDNNGSGYTTAPQVIIAPPIIPLPQIVITPASDLFFSNLEENYFGVSSGSWYGIYYMMQDTSTNWINENFNYNSGINTGTGTYSTIVNTFADTDTYSLALFPVPVQATATAQIVNGYVTTINVDNIGGGYLTTPTVQIIGGGGSGAQATAVNTPTGPGFPPYAISSINITSPGSGYTSPPTVVIAPPTATLNLTYPAQIIPMVRLDLGNTVSNLTYQLQGSPDLVTWTNIGGSYMASSPTNTVYLSATNNAGFYRLQYLL